MWSIHEKNQRPKISCYCPFKKIFDMKIQNPPYKG
jgi:hypothetical protein